MRWAFWRRDRSGAAGAPLGRATWPPPQDAPPARQPEEDDPDRVPASPFSGAQPEPGEHLEVPPLPGVPGPVPSALELSGVRAGVLALVGAAQGRDLAAADAALAQLDERSADGATVAALAAMAVLGERLVHAAGHELDAGPDALAEVVAQGQTLAGRADALLRAVAPDASSRQVALVLRASAGVLELDPPVGCFVEEPAEDLVRVAAVLLAQSVQDGEGDLAALADELADLLPD